MTLQPTKSYEYWRRVHRIGSKIIHGPEAIHPPANIDDFGWVECDLRLQITSLDGKWEESIAIYTDCTMNRYEDYLKPVIRHAQWHRRKDQVRALRAEITWPEIEISLSYFHEHYDSVDTLIRQIQSELISIPFAISGLTTEREGPELPEIEHPDGGYITIYSRNGTQSIEFATPMLVNNQLTTIFSQSFSQLKSLVTPLSKEGWREVYYRNLDNTEPGEIWYWDYVPLVWEPSGME